MHEIHKNPIWKFIYIERFGTFILSLAEDQSNNSKLERIWTWSFQIFFRSFGLHTASRKQQSPILFSSCHMVEQKISFSTFY